MNDDQKGLYKEYPYEFELHQRSDNQEWTSNGGNVILEDTYKGRKTNPVNTDGVCFPDREDAITYWHSRCRAWIDNYG